VNRLLAVAAVAGILASGSVRAAPPSPFPDCFSPPHTWVLLGISVFNGAVTMRDTARDADTVSVCYGEGLPVYSTKAACQAALRHAIQKYSGRSHAEGNYGSFLCTDFTTWTQGQ
jgi:hypothetical protein